MENKTFTREDIKEYKIIQDSYINGVMKYVIF